ncbi:MAG: heavy-metal-associated domain-containing protein [Moheibacter sp.]
MKTFKFKTNINCNGCVAGVTPFLNKVEGIDWKVEIENPDKILTVETQNAQEEEIVKAVRKAGFEIETV